MRRLLLTIWFGSRLLSAAPQEDNQALAQKAVAAERRGDYADAVSAFQELIRNGADSPELRGNLGIAYFQMHDFRGALQQFRVALSKSPESISANLFSGLSLLELQHPKQALPYLQKAYRTQPQDITTLLALARAEVASGDLSQAREFYGEASRSTPQNAEAWYGLGIVDRVLAEQELKQAKRSEQTAGGSEAFRKSQALLNSSKQAMSKAMQLDPGSVRTHMVLGESFRIAERYDLAIREYKAATERAPDSAPAWGGLAAAYSASGNDAAALAAAKRALSLDPNDADTNTLLAAIFLRQGEYAKAESPAMRALQTKPGLSSARLILAKIYLAEHKPEKAVPELERAAKDDTTGNTYYLLGTALRELGKPAESAAAMRKYKQLHHVPMASVSK